MRLLNRSAGRLSRHRRGPLAGLLVLLLGLLLTGGLYSALAPAQAETDADDAALVEEGRQLFIVGCAFCHGQNGEGILTQEGTQYGPPLTDVGAAAVDFQVGTGRMPMAQPGSQAPRKEVVYDDHEIEALSAYVASLGTGPEIPSAELYDPETIPDANDSGSNEDEMEEYVVRGGQVFLANCTACHNFEGSGGAMPRGGYAPKIRGVDAKHIYEAMLTGPQSMDTFSDGNIPPDDKKAVIAYLETLEEAAELQRLHLRRSRPGERGPGRLDHRHRRPGRLRHLDRRPLHPLEQAEGRGGSVSDAHESTVPDTTAHGGGEVATQEPIADPGLPPHTWRPTDVDPKKEKRAELQVAGLFGLSAVCTVLFAVAYFTLDIGDNWTIVGGFGASTMALGLTLGLALLLIGVGIIQWARKLMGDHEISELRHPARSSDEDREATLAALSAGLEESGIGRRPLVRNSLLGSLALLGIPAVVMLRDLGPLPGDTLEHTIWGEGGRVIDKESGERAPLMRIVRDGIWTPILVSDLEIGDLVNAQPEAMVDPERYDIDPAEVEGINLQIHKSKASLILLRMDPADIKPGKDRENWSVEGIVGYSKICTHVGCPISLNERTTHHLLCPCHQSTFDLADSGKVVFGPAGRPLPQLPLTVDEQGYLVAQSDFTEPVGPSYWERDYEER